MKETPLRIIKRGLAILICIVMLVGVLPSTVARVHAGEEPVQSLNYVDLNNWTNHGDGNWSVEPGGRTVEQTINGNPTFFLSPEVYMNTVITGTIQVNTASDDDMIGFVMGYENTDNDYDFILFDWKQSRQIENSYSTAVSAEGYTLGHFNGELSGETYYGGLGSYSKYFWYHEEEPGKFDLLGTDWGTGKGWADYAEYQFKILYTDNRIKIVINDQLIFDVSGTFQPGKIGFYNSSQSNVIYGNVQVAPGTSDSANPVAQSDRYGMSMNGILAVDRYDGLLFNDYDPNLDNYTIEIISGTSKGSLNVNTTTGAFTYNPETDFTGMDSFTYNLLDEEGYASETVTVEINVIEGTNLAPTDLALSNVVIDPDVENGTVLGTLNTTDPNEGDFHDYMLVDNVEGRFSIHDNRILIKNSAIIYAGDSYNLIVRSTDFQGEYLDKTFVIHVPYTVAFEDYDGRLLKTERVLAGDAASPPTGFERIGYTFSSWNPSDYSMISANQTFIAQWTANQDTPYRVEHYLMDVDGNGYSLADTQVLAGVTDTTATAQANSYTGFTENTGHVDRRASGTIAGDGSLVLKLYYDRNTYAVRFDTDGGSPIIDQTDVSYDAKVAVPQEPTKPGYTFAGWYRDIDLNTSWDFDTDTMPSANLTLYAQWTANQDTPYQVEHYLMDVDGNGYSLADTENLTGVTDTTATAQAKSYTGFTENTGHVDRRASGTIAGDGRLVLKLYYDRNPVNLSYKNNDDLTGISLTGLTENIIILEDEKKNALSISFNVRIEAIEDNRLFAQLNTAAENLDKKNYDLHHVFDISIAKSVTTLDGMLVESDLPDNEIAGLITIRIPIPEALKGNLNLAVAYIDDEGGIEILQSNRITINGIDYLQFETNHFSFYAIVAGTSSQEMPQTKETATQGLFGLMMLLGAGIILILRRRAVRT